MSEYNVSHNSNGLFLLSEKKHKSNQIMLLLTSYWTLTQYCTTCDTSWNNWPATTILQKFNKLPGLDCRNRGGFHKHLAGFILLSHKLCQLFVESSQLVVQSSICFVLFFSGVAFHLRNHQNRNIRDLKKKPPFHQAPKYVFNIVDQIGMNCLLILQFSSN